MKNATCKPHLLEYSLLILITLLAAGLRFYKLGDWSYFIDELRTLENSSDPYSRSLSSLLYPNSRQAFWMMTNLSLEIFGTNAFALRFFPCLFGVLTVPLAYFPFKKMFNQRVALFATFVIAISPWHIYLSQFARWYSLLLLVSAIALISFYLFIERGSLKYLVFYIVLFFFALSLHLTAGFLLIIGVAYLFLLLLLPDLRPEHFHSKKVLVFLSVLIGVALLFIPRFLDFVAHWQSLEETVGYWGNTPLNIFLKLLFHITPSLVVVSGVGLLVLFSLKRREGLFLAIYCLIPTIALILVAASETNVSARYLFFTLPGVLLAASYVCIYFVDHFDSGRKFIAAAMTGAILLPSLEADFFYFTSGYGHRDRLHEAVQFMKPQMLPDDQVWIQSLANATEVKFYFQTVADLAGLELKDAQLIRPSAPNEIDLSRRVWVVTRNRSILPQTKGLLRWISDHTHVIAEFPANRGPEDNTIRLYLYSPDDQYRQVAH